MGLLQVCDSPFLKCRKQIYKKEKEYFRGGKMKKIIQVPYIDQSIKYPTGCESVSTVMLLQYLGYNSSVDDFISKYLEQKEFETVEGCLYGADPREYFCGSPYDKDSFGCYAPVICKALEKAIAKYKELVSDYTNTSNHQTKELFRKTIEDIKCAFKTELSKQFKERLTKLRGKVIMLDGPTLFGERTKAEKAELKKLKEKLKALEKEQDDTNSNKLYEEGNAFEWRFQFPQLLDNKGQFTGFDIVIGNPPYGAKLSDTEKKIFKEKFSDVHMRTPETFCYFTSMAFRLSSKTRCGIVAYIVPNNIFFQNENEKTRILLAIDNTLLRAINLGDNTFEDADVPTCIFIAKQEKLDNYNIAYSDYRNDNVKNIEWQ